MIDTDDTVREPRAQLLFQTKSLAHAWAPCELGIERFGKRVVHVQYDLASRQTGQQSRQHEEIRQVVNVHNVQLTLAQQAQAYGGRRPQKPEV